MHKLVIAAPAKINLSLDIVGKRQDGYHLLATVMQSISLHDRVILQAGKCDAGSGYIDLASSSGSIPSGSGNLAWRAADAFLSAAFPDCNRPDLSIFIEKNIPVAAGLAGGSTDAAAVIFGLQRMFPGCLSEDQIARIALGTGADVPFCLSGGTVLCEGIGEILTPLRPWPDLPVLLCCPAVPLLTAKVFAAYAASARSVSPDTAGVLQAVACQSLTGLAHAAGNVLEPVSCAMLPELMDIKNALSDTGAVLARMSGSGPSVFGIYENARSCESARSDLQSRMPPSMRILTCASQACGQQILAEER